MSKKSLVVLLVGLLASSVFADLIDFTDVYYKNFINSQYQEGDGRYTTGWLAVEGSSLEIKLTATPKNQKLTWNQEHGLLTGDGIGIGDDEITGSVQKLTVEFKTPVKVESIDLLDLYYENNNNKAIAYTTGQGYTEIGTMSISGGGNVVFLADIAASVADLAYQYGAKHVTVNSGILTSSVDFTSQNQKVYLGNPVSYSGNNDYAVAKINVTHNVPEPALFSQIAVGMVCFVAFVATKRKKS